MPAITAIASSLAIACTRNEAGVEPPIVRSESEQVPVIIGSSPMHWKRPPRSNAAANSAPEEKPETIQVREWRHRDRDYKDRNGDGIVDWQAEGTARTTDGYGIYKEDNDFDGFYEREYEAGGFAYEVIRDEAIRERVPQIHRVSKPTRIRTVPKPN